MRRRAVLGALALPAVARAQGQRPVRILVGFAPGGLTDTLARVVAPVIGAKLGHTCLVENRPGAAGVIAAEAVAKAPPDGALLLMGHPTALAIAPALGQALPFDAARAFAPISLMALQPHLLIVKGDAAWRDAPALIADAKRRPGEVSYGSSGVASVQHVAGEALAAAGGARFTHVPYRGSAPTMVDIAGGSLGFAIDGVGVSAPMIESGQLKAIGASHTRRVARFPAVPTLIEQGFAGFAIGSWFGLVGPAGLPAPLLATLQAACVECLATPEGERALRNASAEGIGSSAEEFAAWIAGEIARYRALGVKLEG
jgi:tripartite-type tricarboxylate transporter receptor subunit TctC